MKEFKGKVALITGAANGIGKSFAQEAARRGMKLALVDIEGEILDEIKPELLSLGAPDVINIAMDLSIYENVRLTVLRVMRYYGQIDVCFSNAGVAGAGFVDSIPPQDWDWICGINYLGMAYLVHEVLPIMKKQGTDAAFLFTSSIAGLSPGYRFQSSYMASKHAALSLAESVRNYAENEAPYIAVSVFCPEYINTTIHLSERRRPPQYTKYDPYYEDPEYLDYKAGFDKSITVKGMNPRFVGPRLFRAIEDNQMYIVPHMHTHATVIARHRRIEADMLKDEELDAEFKPLQTYDD